MSNNTKDKTNPTTTTEEDKPKRKHVLTPLEAQQEKLDKLFEKIDKPVYIPEPPKEKNIVQAPKDFIRNVSGKWFKKEGESSTVDSSIEK